MIVSGTMFGIADAFEWDIILSNNTPSASDISDFLGRVTGWSLKAYCGPLLGLQCTTIHHKKKTEPPKGTQNNFKQVAIQDLKEFIGAHKFLKELTKAPQVSKEFTTDFNIGLKRATHLSKD